MHSPQAVSQVYVLWLAHLLRRHIFFSRFVGAWSFVEATGYQAPTNLFFS